MLLTTQQKPLDGSIHYKGDDIPIYIEYQTREYNIAEDNFKFILRHFLSDKEVLVLEEFDYIVRTPDTLRANAVFSSSIETYQDGSPLYFEDALIKLPYEIYVFGFRKKKIHTGVIVLR